MCKESKEFVQNLRFHCENKFETYSYLNFLKRNDFMIFFIANSCTILMQKVNIVTGIIMY